MQYFSNFDAMIINKKILLYYSSIFIVFLISIFLVQNRYRDDLIKDKISSRLNTYFELIEHTQDTTICHIADTLVKISVIDFDGNIIFTTNSKNDYKGNPTKLPEFQEAKKKCTGFHIRKSAAYNTKFSYYVKKYKNCYIQIAEPFDIKLNKIRTNWGVIIITGLLYLLASFASVRISQKFYNTIATLKKLVERLHTGDKEDFANDDINEISDHIIQSYKRLERTKKTLDIEREKLQAHLRLSKRGLTIFSPQRKEILSNDIFIQLINCISNKQIQYTEQIFDIPELFDIIDFLNDVQRNNSNEIETKQVEIEKNDSIYSVLCITFQDKSFEIIIEDITVKEEQSILKRQLTQNISHELKTPISSIQGYTETLLNNPNIPEQKRISFIERCHAQAIRLGELLEDISILNKLDEASKIYKRDSINLNEIITGIASDVALSLNNKEMKIEINLPENMQIEGNQSLIYSIFRNLVDNSIKYAGANSTIFINCYRTDKDFYYFSVADNGIGVDKSHLSNIFNRFYRVDDGRSRKAGGSGLGLSIVKNAISYHQGVISAKPYADGGLEFIFTLRKTYLSNPKES